MENPIRLYPNEEFKEIQLEDKLKLRSAVSNDNKSDTDKKILAKPEQTTRLKIIAKQFGVSEMQFRRIKSGENWSQVKI